MACGNPLEQLEQLSADLPVGLVEECEERLATVVAIIFDGADVEATC